MRISIVGPAHPYKGGAAHHTTMLAHRAASHGHRVVLESWSAQYPARLYPGQLTVDQPEMPLFDPTRRSLSWRRPDGWLRHGRRMGRDSDLVVLMFHSPVQVPAYLGILRGLRGTGARTVVIANNVVAHEGRKYHLRLVRSLLRRADAVLVHGAEQGAEAHQLTVKPIRIAALPPHMPGLPIEPALSPAHGSGTRHQEPSNRLLFFGLVRPYKGLDVLLRALAKAKVGPELIVAGEFWHGEDEIRILVAELGLTDRVSIRAGYVDAAEIPTLFGSVDALVLPYRHATGSQNALLAFRYGLPVIVTRTGTLAEAVDDGRNGIVCAPDNVDDLARAIDAFYAPGEPQRLRCGVEAPDDAAAWTAYISALVSTNLTV